MKIAVALAALLLSTAAFAEKADAYQVTGSVAEVSDSKIVVMKGKERFEIERAPDAKVVGEAVKQGDKVTVHYRMTATSIENKGGAKKK
jgi:hypothetical protein